MTPQEMFDKAYLGVIQQGQKSLNSLGGCAYRGQNRTKCGIGYLISDNLAHAWDDLSQSSIWHLNRVKHPLMPEFLKEHHLLAKAIQQAHDAADPGNFVEDFKRNMACVAPAFRLTIPQLEQHQ